MNNDSTMYMIIQFRNISNRQPLKIKFQTLKTVPSRVLSFSITVEDESINPNEMADGQK